MAISANSYGSVTGVGALTPRWSGANNDFVETDRPTLATVESHIDQVSSALNVALAQSGFEIPITQVDCLGLLAFFVNEECAAIVEGLNGSGRFGPSVRNPGSRRRMLIIAKDVADFVEAYADGFEDLGATRTRGIADGLNARTTNDGGDDIVPLFQREAFGNSPINWDV